MFVVSLIESLSPHSITGDRCQDEEDQEDHEGFEQDKQDVVHVDKLPPPL